MTAPTLAIEDLQRALEGTPAQVCTSAAVQWCAGSRLQLGWHVTTTHPDGTSFRATVTTEDQANAHCYLYRTSGTGPEVTMVPVLNPQYQADCLGAIPPGDPYAEDTSGPSWMPNRPRFCTSCAIVHWSTKQEE